MPGMITLEVTILSNKQILILGTTEYGLVKQMFFLSETQQSIAGCTKCLAWAHWGNSSVCHTHTSTHPPTHALTHARTQAEELIPEYSSAGLKSGLAT